MTRKRSHHFQVSLPASPEAIKNRLDRRLLRIGSVWFPTRKELRAWETSEVPLYIVRSTRPDLEVGPWLDSLWAACFSPVLHGRLETTDEGTRITWTRGWPQVTRIVLWSWTVVLATWFLILAPPILSGTEHPISLLWWALLTGSRIAAPVLGGHYGGQTLDAHVPWLLQVAEDGAFEENDR